MRKFKILVGLLLFVSSLFSKNFTDLEAFQAAVKNASPGDTITLEPGEYFGNTDLDYRKGPTVFVVMHGVKITGESDNKKRKYALDVKGNNITVLADGLKLIGGNSGVLGFRGHNLTIISDLKGYITGHNRGCLEMGTNHYIEGLNFDGLGNIGISGQGFPIKDDLNRTFSRNFGWFPPHNWTVNRCIFQNIKPTQPGDAGGGIRDIPHIRNRIVANSIFRNIKGSALWNDHGQKDLYYLFNLFENIETADTYGKALFIEIQDPPKNDKSGYVAVIAGNTFRRCQTQTILIAASSGQNPGGIHIYGNTIDGGWGITCGAMQRTFQRKWDARDPSKNESVVARLENILIEKNLINPTSPNHISIFQGRNSGLIEIDNNYYVTGGTGIYTRNGVEITRPIDGVKIHSSDPNSEGLFIHGEANSDHLDKNAITGPMPESFPFPEVFNKIPFKRMDIDGNTINVPDPDTTITDTPETSVPDRPLPNIGELPRIWVTSDMDEADGRTDDDDKLWLAFMAFFQDRADFVGITVGAHKYDLPRSLDWANSNIGLAYAQERDNLNAVYGGFPESLPFMAASTMGKGFKEGLESLDNYPSVKGIVDAASEGKLFLLNGGPLGEIATAVEYGLRKNPAAVANMTIISHATTPGINNCIKDQKACDYLHDLAAQGKIKFIECGFSGKIIDNKPFPKMGGSILQSKIGAIFKYKWQVEKPDFSDGITFVILAFPELGGGPEFLAKLNQDGTTNLQTINALADQIQDWKGKLYDLINERGEVAKGDYTPEPGNGNGNPNPSPDPTTKDRVIKAIGILEELLKELESIKNALN